MHDGVIVKIGFLSLPITGHLNPMAALARKLQSRGHEIVFIGVPDIEPVVRAADGDYAEGASLFFFVLRKTGSDPISSLEWYDLPVCHDRSRKR